jgi:Ser-tRNA(Ala) deacylase AlaX
MANEKIGALNRKFKTQEKSWHIEIDYSYLPIFQENIREKSVSTKQMADAFAIMYRDQAITLDQYKAELLKLGIGGKS